MSVDFLIQSRAAERLLNSGSLLNPFDAFSQFSPENLSRTELLLIDGNVGLILKKLSKRDTVTRVKALEELLVGLSSLTKDEFDSLMPSWVASN